MDTDERLFFLFWRACYRSLRYSAESTCLFGCSAQHINALRAAALRAKRRCGMVSNHVNLQRFSA